MAQFLKQSDNLRNWGLQLKAQALANLSSYGVRNITGTLRNSIRLQSTANAKNPFRISYVFYGDIIQTTYPAGHKWGRGKLKNTKAGKPWFDDALYKDGFIDSFATILAEDYVRNVEGEFIAQLGKI